MLEKDFIKKSEKNYINSMDTNYTNISAMLITLKDGVDEASNLILDMLDGNRSTAKVEENKVSCMVSLLIYDSIVSKDVNYSYLNDIQFNNEGYIIVKNTNHKQVKDNISFMKEYLDYRIKYPIDEAKC